MGMLNDVAHDGIVQRVEDPGADHDRSDRPKLSVRQLLCEQDKCQKIVCDQCVDHIPADSAERKHDQVLFHCLIAVHDKHLV